MANISGDGGGVASDEIRSEAVVATPTPSQPLAVTASGSLKEGKSSPRRRASVRPSLDADEFLNLLHRSEPVKMELNRLDNEVRDKDRELSEAAVCK